MTNGTASLSSAMATTNGSGFAGITAQVTNLSITTQASACISPANSPCKTFTLFAVPPSSWRLEAVSGMSQIVPNGQAFRPLVMRVTDGSAADNPVMGATVTFTTTLERNPQGPGGPVTSQSASGVAANGMPIILGTSTSQVVTGSDGLASIAPTVGSLGPCNAFIMVTAGFASAQFELQNVDPLIFNQQPNTRSQPSGSRASGGRSVASPAVPQDAPAILVAMPQGILLPDSSSNACSILGQDATCASNADSAPKTFPLETMEAAQRTAAPPKVENAARPGASFAASGTAQRKSAKQQRARKPRSLGAASQLISYSNTTRVATPTTTAHKLSDDTRSCRFALGEDGLTP